MLSTSNNVSYFKIEAGRDWHFSSICQQILCITRPMNVPSEAFRKYELRTMLCLLGSYLQLRFLFSCRLCGLLSCITYRIAISCVWYIKIICDYILGVIWPDDHELEDLSFRIIAVFSCTHKAKSRYDMLILRFDICFSKSSIDCTFKSDQDLRLL